MMRNCLSSTAIFEAASLENDSALRSNLTVVMTWKAAVSSSQGRTLRLPQAGEKLPDPSPSLVPRAAGLHSKTAFPSQEEDVPIRVSSSGSTRSPRLERNTQR